MAWREQSDNRQVLYDSNDNLVLEVGDDASLYNKAGVLLLSGTGGSLPINVTDAAYGASPTKTASYNQGAINAAIIAAEANLAAGSGTGTVFIPDGSYDYAGALTNPTAISGLRIEGQSKKGVILNQKTAASNGFELLQTSTGADTEGIEIARLTLNGPGQFTSSGIGINATNGLVGRSGRVWMTDIEIMNYSTLGRFNRWDTCRFSGRLSYAGADGLYCDGNANGWDIDVQAFQIVGSVIKWGDGFGNQVRAHDVGDFGRFIDLLTTQLGQITLIGGEFERCSGTAFNYVGNSCKLIAIGGNYEKGTANDVNRFLVEGNGLLIVQGTSDDGGGFTVARHKKNATSAIIQELGVSRGSGISPGIVDDGGANYPPSFYPCYPDNAAPAAGVKVRNMIFGVMDRDAGVLSDRLVICLEDRTQGSAAYGLHLLSHYSISKNVDYTLTGLDDLVEMDATSAVRTATLPTAIGLNGRQFTIKKKDASANAVNVATTSSQLIDAAAAPYVLATLNKYVTVQSNGASWKVVGNN